MSCESIGRHPCSLRLVFKRPTDATQFESIPCPAVWKQEFRFLVFLPVTMRDNVDLSQRDSASASARGSIVPSLRETMLLCLKQTRVPDSVRGIVVSLWRDLSLFVCSLVG